MQEPDRVNRFIRRGESLRAVMMAALRRNLGFVRMRSSKPTYVAAGRDQ